MMEKWIVIRSGAGERRVRLFDGLTRCGGIGSDVVLDRTGSDELHIWDDPARAVFVGEGARPRGPEGPFDELSLQNGVEFVWGADRIRYEEVPMAVVEEVPVETEGSFLPQAEIDAWRRVQAGILVEQGLADRVVARNWQQAVKERRFKADECAEEILARSQVTTDDVRVLQRSQVLLRDLLMAPLVKGTRGAGRKAKRAAQGGVAFVLAQGAAFLVYCLIVLAVLIVLRLQGHSLDGWLDRILLRDSG